jgi:predicted phage gp36 major capsid-like protein
VRKLWCPRQDSNLTDLSGVAGFITCGFCTSTCGFGTFTYPAVLDGVINAAATENNYILVYGDFAAGMVVVDHLGSTLEIVPHLFGATRRPTGQRGALLWFRTGSDVVVPQAFRLLSIPTTA